MNFMKKTLKKWSKELSVLMAVVMVMTSLGLDSMVAYAGDITTLTVTASGIPDGASAKCAAVAYGTPQNQWYTPSTESPSVDLVNGQPVSIDIPTKVSGEDTVNHGLALYIDGNKVDGCFQYDGKLYSSSYNEDDLGNVSVSVEEISANAGTSVTPEGVLGEAANYGLVANDIKFVGHFETNFAVKTIHESGVNGNGPMNDGFVGNVIIANYEGASERGGLQYEPNTGDNKNNTGNGMIYTTADAVKYLNGNVVKQDADGNYYYQNNSGWYATLNLDYTTYTKANLESYIDSLIGTVKSNSNTLFNEANQISYSKIGGGVIDIAAMNSAAGTYYIKFESGEFNKFLNNGGTVKINGDQNVVLNIDGDSVDLRVMHLVVDGTDYQSDGYKPIMAEKLIVNCPNATSIKIDGMVDGTFLLPNAAVEQGAVSGGWMVADNMKKIGGTEWHLTKKLTPNTPNIPKDGPTPTATPVPTATPTSTPVPTATATPTKVPTATPTKVPTATPTKVPTATPTKAPTATPTKVPTATPTKAPTATPTKVPTATPTAAPTATPIKKLPTPVPTKTPTVTPTSTPTATPTEVPTATPTKVPTATPTKVPTATPTKVPTATPTKVPTATPTKAPTATPTKAPTATPTKVPTATPTKAPTATPTKVPTATPTKVPTATPTNKPTATPTEVPTATPTEVPTATPTEVPTATPTEVPTATPTGVPTATPTVTPTVTPTATPTPAKAKMSVEFFKVDDKTGFELGGAEFAIYSDVECTAEIATTTSAETTGQVEFTDLEYSTIADTVTYYYIKETKAPEGYCLIDGAITVTISADGTYTYSSPIEKLGERNVFKNRKTTFAFSKRGVEQDGVTIQANILTGAQMSLRSYVDGAEGTVDLSHVVVPNASINYDSATKTITWTTGSEALEFWGLPVGHYILKEEVAPSENYKLADYVVLRVDEYGEIHYTKTINRETGETYFETPGEVSSTGFILNDIYDPVGPKPTPDPEPNTPDTPDTPDTPLTPPELPKTPPVVPATPKTPTPVVPTTPKTPGKKSTVTINDNKTPLAPNVTKAGDVNLENLTGDEFANDGFVYIILSMIAAISLIGAALLGKKKED